MLSRVRLFVTPWTVAYQAPPSVGCSRQEYWSGLPFSSSRRSSQPRDQTWVSRIAGRRFTIWVTREAQSFVMTWVLDSTLCLSHSKIIKQMLWDFFFFWCFCDFTVSSNSLGFFRRELTSCPITMWIILCLPFPTLHLKCHLYYTLNYGLYLDLFLYILINVPLILSRQAYFWIPTASLNCSVNHISLRKCRCS